MACQLSSTMLLDLLQTRLPQMRSPELTLTGASACFRLRRISSEVLNWHPGSSAQFPIGPDHCSFYILLWFPLPSLAYLDFQLLPLLSSHALLPASMPSASCTLLVLQNQPTEFPGHLFSWITWFLAHVSCKSSSVLPNVDTSTGVLSPSSDAPCPDHCPLWSPLDLGILFSLLFSSPPSDLPPADLAFFLFFFY